MATWNVRSLNGKEEELSMESGMTQLDIFAVTETKKRGLAIFDNRLIAYTFL